MIFSPRQRLSLDQRDGGDADDADNRNQIRAEFRSSRKRKRKWRKRQRRK